MSIQSILRKVVFLIFAVFLIFTACEDLEDMASTRIERGDRSIIAGDDLAVLVQIPAGGQRRQTVILGNVDYTATLDWYESTDGVDFNEAFGVFFIPGLIYRAEITMTANKGFTFDGTVANSFSHTKAADISNPEGDGARVKVTIVFPVTPKANDVIITATNLTSIFSPPIRRGVVPGWLNHSQYSANVTWETLDGAEANNFAPETAYRAILKLSPQSGFTLSGLSNESFSHASAQDIRYNIGDSTLIIEFQPTGAEDGTEETVTMRNLTDLIPVPVHRTMPVTSLSNPQYSGIISWFSVEDSNDEPVAASFPSEKPIKAVLTLDPEDGFTFTGIIANAFLHDAALQISNDAGENIVTVIFPPAQWIPGRTIFPVMTTATVKGCCWAENRPPQVLVNGNFDGGNRWERDYGSIQGGAFTNRTSWPEIMYANAWSWPDDPHRENAGGHPSVFSNFYVPIEIRIPARVITIDLQSVWHDISTIGFYPRRDGDEQTQSFPGRIQIFFSETIDIPPIFDPKDPEIGMLPELEFKLGPDFPAFPPFNWRYMDLAQHTEGGRGFSARYIHIRFIGSIGNTNPYADWGSYVSFNQLRLGRMED